MPEPRAEASLSRLVHVLFFATGVAGLLLQVAWFRLLALSLGGTLAAATVTLSAFMLGLALGAALFARQASRVCDPLRVYGLLEVAAGVLALLSPFLLRVVDDLAAFAGAALPEQETLRLAFKLLMAGLVLVPPTACMGATLPALAQALVRRAASSGGGTGGLAALNTLGAVAGTLLAMFVVLPRLGLTACISLGATVDLLAGLAALLLARKLGQPPATSPAPVADTEPARVSTSRRRLFALLLFAVGSAGIAYEILWTRALAFAFGSGAQAFAIMLAVVLLGWALGAFLGGELADRTGRPAWVLAGSQALLPVAVAWQIHRLPDLPDFLYLLALQVERVNFVTLTLLFLVGAVQVILPAAVLMGMAFPAGVRALARDGGAGDAAGLLSSANSLGTIPGAVIAAWVLVPAIGLQRSLLAVAALNLAVAATALLAEPRSRRPRPALLALALAGAAVLLGALWRLDTWRIYAGSGVFQDEAGASTLLALEESPHGAVTLSRVDDDRGRWLSLAVDAVNVAGTSPGLLACQELQGQLPLLLHADPRRVLHVGFGSGGTARAVATHAGVERIDIVEINPAIPRMSDARLRAVNDGVLADPRVHLHLEDGRNRLLATDERWDCILSDSIHPRYRGNASLYTIEYFRLCRSRLAPGGLVSTWLPIYSLSPESLRSIVRSMREVFPRTSAWYLNSTINEFVILVGRTDDAPIDAARMRRALAEPQVSASLARIGVGSVVDVLDFLVAEGEELGSLGAEARLNEDDWPWVEFESAAVMDRDGSWRVNLRQVLAARRPAGPVVRGLASEELDALAAREAATTEQLRGQVALLSGDSHSASEAFSRAASMPGFDREPWDAFGAPPWPRELQGLVVRER